MHNLLRVWKDVLQTEEYQNVCISSINTASSISTKSIYEKIVSHSQTLSHRSVGYCLQCIISVMATRDLSKDNKLRNYNCLFI